jgi:hypothetical protein
MDEQQAQQEQQTYPFSTRAEFGEHLLRCLSGASQTLQMFDPDFSLWELGSSGTDTVLRRFLAGHGKLQLVAHSNAHLERHAPRLLRLLKDYGHAIECRLTNKSVRHLTDSFCIADGRDMVRRFHSDHLRGEAVFHAQTETQLYLDRFEAIWQETGPGLHADATGL